MTDVTAIYHISSNHIKLHHNTLPLHRTVLYRIYMHGIISFLRLEISFTYYLQSTVVAILRMRMMVMVVILLTLVLMLTFLLTLMLFWILLLRWSLTTKDCIFSTIIHLTCAYRLYFEPPTLKISPIDWVLIFVEWN